MNTTVNTVLKVKDSFAVEAGSGPRHLTFSKGVMFMYYRNLLEV
jgi:6-phosphogluconolactonase